MNIDLNCDCGESFGPWSMGADAEILAHVTSANIACGAHAGDPDVMRRTVRLARDLGVSVGAHPGFADLQGFGRRVLALSPDEIANSVLTQIGALYAIARAERVALTHVKPHGALYNYAAVTPAVAAAIAQAVAAFDRDLILVGLAGSALIDAGRAAGLQVAGEAFADRVYEADGQLRSRRFDDAMVLEREQSLSQALSIVTQGYVVARSRERLPIQADTICLHGDAPDAAARAAFVRQGLQAAGVSVVALPQLLSDVANRHASFESTS